MAKIEKTLMIFGPGGIGKSPIDRIVRSEAVRVDPYRLRPSGPRDSDDVFCGGAIDVFAV